MNIYQQFIHKSRYARWNEELGRREHWGETVDRYINFIKEHCKERETPLPQETLDELREAIFNLEVMPSMRALMTAGKAAKKDFVATYNCAYLPIDNIKSFDEILYILACGTGCGFSVEEMYTSKLPEIPDSLNSSETVINVPDSKIGWATSLRELISLLYAGKIPKWDVSKVRPKGARLKTFGGFASGAEPLVAVFEFVVSTFKKAVGRKLTTLECHDIVCKIAECIIVGSVRRSALISLSDLSDERMRTAKSGAWWEENVQRALANNSAVHNAKPEIGKFLSEWKALYESKSGERGFFNRDFAVKHSKRFGRRAVEGHIYGGNPCQPAFAPLLTRDGIRTLGDVNVGDKIWSSEGWTTVVNKWLTGVKPVFAYKTTAGIFYGTVNHRIVSCGEKVEVGIAETIDVLRGCKASELNFEHTEIQQAIMDGLLVGDGSVHLQSKEKIYLTIGGKDRDYFDSEIKDLIIGKHAVNKDTSFKVQTTLSVNDLPKTYLRQVPENYLKSNPNVVCAFLRGLYSANGSICGNRVTLKAASKSIVEQVQLMLSSIGIKSYITTNKGKEVEFANGTYLCRDSYDLNISEDKDMFNQTIGFIQKYKQEKLQSLIKSNSSRNYKNSYEIVSTEYIGELEVFDITVDNASHTYWSGGLNVSNCNEIFLRPYQFCNLSNVILRPDDDLDKVKKKVEIATIIGTIQSSFTDFRYLRSIWKKNCEEERLLGVGMSAIMDNPMMNAWQGYSEEIINNYTKGVTKTLSETLDILREHSVEVNEKWSKHLGINQSVAITCVKPDGNSSQLNKCSSGIHPAYSRYYIRTVRMAKTDPLSKFLIAYNIPVEDDITNPNTGYVFSFPMKTSDHSVLRDEVSAIDQLELYKVYQNHYTEHKPSITVYVRENEWIDVAAWVYKNFDSLGGVSFLPHSDHVYKQAPYQEITKEEYEALLAKYPTEINWDDLAKYELEDGTTGTQELSCSAGVCDII